MVKNNRDSNGRFEKRHIGFYKGKNLSQQINQIKSLYHEKKLSLFDIGEKFNVSKQVIYYQMKKHNIPRRNRGEHTEISKEKISKKLKGRVTCPDNLWKKGHIDLVSKEARKEAGKKISKKLMNRIISKEWRDKISKSSKNKIISKETRDRMSEASKKRFENPEEIRKCLRRRKMSSLERKFNDTIIKNNLPYRFVGNGDFLIGRKCPDFVNTNGEKIAIEVYYRKHKEMFRGDVNLWKQERQDIFNKYGWRIEFFNEIQVTEDKIINRLK